MKDHLREKQTEGWEEVFPVETEEDFIPGTFRKGSERHTGGRMVNTCECWKKR